LTAASQSVGGKWGWQLRLTASLASDVASSIALVECQSDHLFHHLMLILMEEILLVGQCLNVLAHLLGPVDGSGSRQRILIPQCRHLCRDRFGGVIFI